MTSIIDESTLHRTAKYFMDNGRAETHEAAIRLLGNFRLTVRVGHEIRRSTAHQVALLTIVNVARRTLLGGIDVIGLPDDAACLTPLAPAQSIADAVRTFGGRLADQANPDLPTAIIGSAEATASTAPCWQVTWAGWRGGIIPLRDRHHLSEDAELPLAPALAAAVCAAEAFAYFAGDHAMAGRRATGLSLWQPGAEWLLLDPTEPTVAYLPSRLWLIGLGNLGQAFAWLLAALPYRDPTRVQLVLQDFDRIAASNDSTSLLSFIHHVGHQKARIVADWLDARGFQTFIEERRFGTSIRRADDEPAVALCGVDNANARAALEGARFGLIVEAGLGAGPQAFRSIAMHTFPASRRAAEIWTKQVGDEPENIEHQPAYRALRDKGIDACGLTRLASRTVGVPFVGLIAGCLVISELLRRLNGGVSLELASCSVSTLEHVDTVRQPMVVPYAFGHLPTQSTLQPKLNRRW